MRLEINYKNKNTYTWRLNYVLLNTQWVTEEIKEEIKKYMETNENDSAMILNQRAVAKEFLRGKLRAIQDSLLSESPGEPSLISV